jgi:hypothetical protein
MSLRTLDLEDGLAGIGYWVVSAARGRGIAPRALVAVSDWAINELGLHRLELEHSTKKRGILLGRRKGWLLLGEHQAQPNTASGRVA